MKPLFTPIKKFFGIPADSVTDAFNALINDINARLAALGLGGEAASGVVTIRQMKLALIAQGNLLTVHNVISALIEDPLNVAWMHGATVTQGDPLSNFIAATLAYSPAQMVALFALATQQVP